VQTYYLATIEDTEGPAVALVRDESVHVLPGRRTLRDLLQNWPRNLERLEAALERGALGPARRVSQTRFLPPVPNPPNLYMAGANYLDHVREMRGLAADAPVEKPAAGPFMFLKPTTTLVGHKHPVTLARGAEDVDWEVELAAVIGRRAYRVAAEDALDYVAGYTVVNDISVRGGWKREGAEPPMTWDWLWQKGWQTSCPCGPWLLPARLCPAPGDLAITLTVNGSIEQQSRTSNMIFSLEEQVEYLSRLLPLVPGDIVSTGTCAGVGAGKGRFLTPGDLMVATIEHIGTLENAVVAEGGE
jgi:2,4-diketo-3-deoxy-L-fuconate hydrolase